MSAPSSRRPRVRGNLPAMLITIADESQTLERYACRAQAYAASEATPPSELEMVEAWCLSQRAKLKLKRMPAGARSHIHAALHDAARLIVTKRERLWGSLVTNINLSDIDNNEGE